MSWAQTCTTSDFDPPDDVTLLDTALAAVERPKRVTLTSDDLEIVPIDGERNNSHPDISSDGSLVAWVTAAARVVVGEPNTNNLNQIYVRDRSAGTTTFVSFDGQDPGDGASNFPRIAQNHRIFFESKAQNLVTPDVNGGTSDVFEYDFDTGVIVLLSRRVDDSVQGDKSSAGPAPSDTGRFVAFTSRSTNLVSFVPGLLQTPLPPAQPVANPYMDCPELIPSVDQSQIHLLDRGSGFDSGTPISQWDYGPAIAWISVGRDGVGNCEQPHDFIDPVLEIVDTSDGRGDEDPRSEAPDISANGCRVVFQSEANNLIAGQNITHTQIYVWERATLEVSLVSHEPGLPALPGDDESLDPAISDDGKWVVFRSFAKNLVSPPDLDGNPEIFVVDLDVRPFVPTKINWGVGNPAQQIDTYSSDNNPGFRGPYISPNGRWITLACNIPEYLKLPDPAGDNPNAFDTLIHDRDGDGDGIWNDPVSLYLHLRDPNIPGGDPYANGNTVPFFRFTRTLGPPGDQYQEIISTTTAQDLNQNLNPADTNGTLPGCTALNCGDDIYVRKVWEE